MSSVAVLTQRGNAILMVSVIGFVAMAGLGTSSVFSILSEGRVVEESLAETRAYWAAVGHANYALSRTRQAGVCIGLGNCNTDVERAATVQAFLDEITSLRRASFPEVTTNYYIDVDAVAAEAPIPGKNTMSGHLHLSLSYPTAGASTVPALNTVVTRSKLRGIDVQFCVGLDAPTPGCNDPNVALGASNFGGINRITALRRPTS